MITCGSDLCGACKGLMRYEKHDRGSAQNILAGAGDLQGKMIDGGAHVGLWALSMIEWYKSMVVDPPKIVAIEPNKHTAKILMRNLDGTHASCVILESALWNKPGSLLLKSGYSPAQDRINELGTTGVEAITLDHIFKNIGKVDLIKLDIEGAEYEAIQGGEHMLKSGGTKLLIAEFRASAYRERGTDPFDTVKLLESYGYVPYHHDINKVNACAAGVKATYNVKFVPQVTDKSFGTGIGEWKK